MFIKIDEQTTINTDHIIWTEEGDHSNNEMTTMYLTGEKTVELTYVGAKTLWKAVKREQLDSLMTR